MHSVSDSSAHFVSEPIAPERGNQDTSGHLENLTAIPTAFSWRGQRLEILAILYRGKGERLDRGERYLNRENFEVELKDRRTAMLYFERQVPRGSSPNRRKQRWFLYTISDLEPPSP